jgi:integrase
MYMLKEPAKANKRERVLSDQEIRAMWHAAGEIGYPYSAATKMTGQRRTEVSAMPIAEVDRKARLWSMPGSRTKNKLDHAVPLSDAFLEIFTAAERNEPVHEPKSYRVQDWEKALRKTQPASARGSRGS